MLFRHFIALCTNILKNGVKVLKKHSMALFFICIRFFSRAEKIFWVFRYRKAPFSGSEGPKVFFRHFRALLHY